MDWNKGLPIAHDPYVGVRCHRCGKLNKTTSESEDEWYYLRMTPMTGAYPGSERERIIILCRECGTKLYSEGGKEL